MDLVNRIDKTIELYMCDCPKSRDVDVLVSALCEEWKIKCLVFLDIA